MGGNDLCSSSLYHRYVRRHLDDGFFAPISRLGGKIIVVKQRVWERIWRKLPAGRRADREWYARQQELFLEGGRRERRSNPDWSRNENPIQYREPAPRGMTHRIVDRDNRAWKVTDERRLMEG